VLAILGFVQWEVVGSWYPLLLQVSASQLKIYVLLDLIGSLKACYSGLCAVGGGGLLVPAAAGGGASQVYVYVLLYMISFLKCLLSGLCAVGDVGQLVPAAAAGGCQSS
jgi:hypothetical protein